MRAIVLATAASLLASSAFGWSGCGVTLDVPKGWTAAVVARRKTDCEVGMRPKSWRAMVRHSRWNEEEFAISLKVYRLSFQKAALDLGFEHTADGRWGVRGRQGLFSDARRVKFGSFSGWRSEPWFHGFAKEGAKLGDESRIYSGNWIILLLRDRARATVAIQYNQWSPDIKLDRDAVASKIARSMRTPP